MLLAMVTQKCNFFLNIKTIFYKSQLFSTNHNYFLQITTISYKSQLLSTNHIFLLEIATNFYNLATFSTISQFFSLQITTFFYNLATFSHNLQLSSTILKLFFQILRLIIATLSQLRFTTRVTEKFSPRPGTLNGNQNVEGEGGGPNQLPKSQYSKYWKRGPTSSIFWL